MQEQRQILTTDGSTEADPLLEPLGSPDDAAEQARLAELRKRIRLRADAKEQTSPASPPKPSVTDCLDLAMEGVSMTIRTMLDQHDNNHRFSEVMRLSVIGKALGRQRARVTKRVSDFERDVGNARAMNQMHQGLGCGRPVDPELGEDLQEVNELANEGNDGDIHGHDAWPPPPPMGGIGPIPIIPGRRYNRPRWVGAPYGVAEDAGLAPDEVAGRAAAEVIQPAMTVISRMNDLRAESDASKARLDRARELETLLRTRKECTDFTIGDVIDRRIAQIVAEMEEQPQPRVDVDEILVEEKTTSSTAVERAVVCTNCGQRHGSHWVNDTGTPIRCDVCGSATMIETEPTPEGHQEQPRA